jgi:hypothetical protein
LTLENETERKLAVVSLIDEQVQRIEWRAIVIGGLAVEFWTQGAYSTSDIDLYLPHGPAVDDLLAELGFRKQGRHWVLPGHDLFVEAPASFPAEDEEVVNVELEGGRSVPVLSAEDVVVDRLHQFVAGGHADVAEQGVALIGIEELDYPRLIVRAKGEGLGSALVELERIALRVGRGEQIPPMSFRRSRNGCKRSHNLCMRKIRFSERLAGRDEARTRLERIRAAFGEYRRERPRDREKARLLRERGTPEDLIGPEH